MGKISNQTYLENWEFWESPGDKYVREKYLRQIWATSGEMEHKRGSTGTWTVSSSAPCPPSVPHLNKWQSWNHSLILLIHSHSMVNNLSNPVNTTSCIIYPQPNHWIQPHWFKPPFLNWIFTIVSSLLFMFPYLLPSPHDSQLTFKNINLLCHFCVQTCLLREDHSKNKTLSLSTKLVLQSPTWTDPLPNNCLRTFFFLKHLY